MELTKSSCEGFLESLASKAPVPGGGGAAALVGAAGVALGNMVGSLTVGKKKYAAVEADVRTLNARAEALRRRLEALVQADAEAFLPLAAAYDAGCAALFCKAALQASGLNVSINTKLMADRAHAEALNAKADALLAQYVPLADTLYEKMATQLRGEV